jgi:hypothetical protein
MKPFKTRSELIFKNVVCRCGEITLKIFKKKPIKSIKIKSHLDISITYPLGIKSLINQKKIQFKRTFENKVQF